MRQPINVNEIIEEIQRVDAEKSGPCLSHRVFLEKNRLTIPKNKILQSFDGKWSLACKAAGVTPCEALSESKIGLEELADEFLRAVLQFSPLKIPTLPELRNRGGSHSDHSYSVKWGGYPTFKTVAITHLLASSKIRDATLVALFRNELEKLQGKTETISQPTIRPHQHGRMLGFRAFAHVPTYEQDVVGIFAAIAHEIGFEIISNRNAFPDCEANRKVEGSTRKRYKKCLIEFELRSSDFKTHKHPVNGCDLIVCWEHDWKDCPLEVLELKKAIQPLSGWKEN